MLNAIEIYLVMFTFMFCFSVTLQAKSDTFSEISSSSFANSPVTFSTETGEKSPLSMESSKLGKNSFNVVSSAIQSMLCFLCPGLSFILNSKSFSSTEPFRPRLLARVKCQFSDS